MAPLRIRLIGERLPGRVVGDHRNVHIGIQKGDEVVELVPGDARSATFDLTVMRRTVADDDVDADDFRGPYVHGKPGDRFLYLSWVDVDDATGTPAMFSRIKVMLAAIPAGVL